MAARPQPARQREQGALAATPGAFGIDVGDRQRAQRMRVTLSGCGDRRPAESCRVAAAR
jgi:hypothetical protein